MAMAAIMAVTSLLLSRAGRRRRAQESLREESNLCARIRSPVLCPAELRRREPAAPPPGLLGGGASSRAGWPPPAHVPCPGHLGAQGAGARLLRRAGRFGLRESAWSPVLAAGHVATVVALVRVGRPAASQSDLGGEAGRVRAHVPPGLHVQELHGFLLSCGSWAPTPAEPLESEGSAGEVRDELRRRRVKADDVEHARIVGVCDRGLRVGGDGARDGHRTPPFVEWDEAGNRLPPPSAGQQSVVGLGVAGRARTGAAGFTTPSASDYTTATVTTGNDRIRTGGLSPGKRALSTLSYTPTGKRCGRQGSDLPPRA